MRKNSMFDQQYDGTKWAHLKANCNINSYSSKKDTLGIEYIPSQSKIKLNEKAMFTGSLKSLANTNYTKNLNNIRNINTCQNNVARKNNKAMNAIDYDIQRRQINSQEAEVLMNDDSTERAIMTGNSLIGEHQQFSFMHQHSS